MFQLWLTRMRRITLLGSNPDQGQESLEWWLPYWLVKGAKWHVVAGGVHPRAPEDIYILMLRTCDYVILQSKGELRIQMELRLLAS